MEETSDTTRLHLITHTENDGRSVFPKEFIDAIRSAVESGFSSEQIVSILLLSTTVLEIHDLDGPELLARTKEVSTVIGGLNRRTEVERNRKRNL